MCEPLMIAAGAVAIAGSVMKGVAQSNQARQQAGIEELNANMYRRAASDAIERGDYEAGAIRMKTSSLVGRQVTSFASSGIDPGVGTAADLENATKAYGEMDVAIARSNAARESWGYRVKAMESSLQAKAYRQQARDSILGGILGGVGQGFGILGGRT